MLDYLIKSTESMWRMLLDSAFLLLVGLVLAGIIHQFLHQKLFTRLFSGKGFSAVFKAALFGIPLPLCSCSVLPVAYQLRRSGLSRGGATSFLVATPETGVDSILLTYSLTDPVMTIARPVTAFLTALVAGAWVDRIKDTFPDEADNISQDSCSDCCSDDESVSVSTQKGLGHKIKYVFSYAWSELLADLAPYLLLGYLLAGLVGGYLGNDISGLSETFRTGWGSYAGAIVIGLPLYICATSSTPLAAVLLSAGFSPGAVLVFMMVGPATNIASLTVVSQILKRKALLVYLTAIVFVSVGIGLVLDWVVYTDNLLNYSAHAAELDGKPGVLQVVSAVVLVIGILYFSCKKAIQKLF